MASKQPAPTISLPLMMTSVVVFAVSNTIIRRIALVPMKNYPYFVTQLQTLMYVIFYCSILFARYKEGIVTKEMLQIRKSPFLYIGIWDAIGDMLGNVGTSHLPGYQVPLLAKLNIVFTAFFSFVLLQKRYTWSQIGSMMVVICGSIVTLLPTILDYSTPSNEQQDEHQASSLFYVGVYIASVAPTALAFVLKEQVFKENEHLNLDIFVVNSYGSIVGLVFTILLLPLASVPGLGKVALTDLHQYMKNGYYCFQGQLEGCEGAPLAPLLYFGINLCYNIAFLLLIKHGGALLTFITNTVTFPLSTILFTLNWPLLGSSTLNWFIMAGLCVELTGIVLYRRASSSSFKESETNELLDANDKVEYGTVATASDYEDDEESEDNYLQQQPPLCYNKTLKCCMGSKCCNKEDICKCLLSPKCHCG